jgi:hypothetical protein
MAARPEGPARGQQSSVKGDIQGPSKPVAPMPPGVASAAAPHPAPVGAPSRTEGRPSAPVPAEASSQSPKAEPKADVSSSPVVSPVAEKHAQSADDPFAGLDSLEAEMAKLLGREKLN